MENIYKNIIETSSIGYAYNRMINDSEGNPTDYVYVEMNPSFERIVGARASDIIGKQGTQVFGAIDCEIIALLEAKPSEVMKGGQHELMLQDDVIEQVSRMMVNFLDNGYFIIEIYKDTIDIRDQYQDVVEYAPIAIASVSTKGEFLDVNDLFCKTLGYKKEVLRNMKFNEITYSEDKKVSRINFFKMIENSQSAVNMEKRYVKRDGSIIWVELSARLLSDSNSISKKIVITIVDITDQKNKEVKLQKSEEKYKSLFNRAPLAYHSLDTDGNLIEVNEQWLDMLGYNREDVIGKWFGDFLAPPCRDEFMVNFPKFKKQGHIQSEFGVLHKKGTILYITFDGKILHDSHGVFKQTQCILKDITKQRELEQALAKNRRLTNSLMANTPDIIYIKNTEGKYLLFNEAAEKLSGKRVSDILGKGVTAVFPADIAEKVMARDKEVLDKKEIITSEEKVKDASGKLHTFLSTKGPIFDEDSVLIGMFGISRDITERTHWEQDLFESEKKYRLITENIADVISVYNITKSHFTFVSPSIVNLRGYSIEEAMTQNSKDYVVPEAIESFGKAMGASLDDFINNPDATNHYINEVQMTHKSTGRIWVEISTRYQYNAAGEIESVNSARSIEERKKSEEVMRQLSYYDQLTGLYNRRFYEEELKRLDTERNLPMALIMADLNGLKLTNDAFGHQAGDQLLKKIAEVLTNKCRTDEIISRIGGDEFVILMPKTNKEEARNLIERINGAVMTESDDNGLLSLSIGYAVKEKVSESMHEIFKKSEDDMYRHKLAESSSMRSKTINIIMNSLYEKSRREMLHSNRVSMICEAIATAMNFNQEEINQAKIAGLVHDIGKIGISNNILDKESKLTRKEWVEVKKHCEVGYRILSSVNEFSEIAEYVLSHQEKWDGTGYPQGLVGQAIPIQSRIITIADAFDAMTSDRTYRLGMSKAEAIKEIIKCKGSQFDPEIARIFVEEVLLNI